MLQRERGRRRRRAARLGRVCFPASRRAKTSVRSSVGVRVPPSGAASAAAPAPSPLAFAAAAGASFLSFSPFSPAASEVVSAAAGAAAGAGADEGEISRRKTAPPTARRTGASAGRRQPRLAQACGVGGGRRGVRAGPGREGGRGVVCGRAGARRCEEFRGLFGGGLLAAEGAAHEVAPGACGNCGRARAGRGGAVRRGRRLGGVGNEGNGTWDAGGALQEALGRVVVEARKAVLREGRRGKGEKL